MVSLAFLIGSLLLSGFLRLQIFVKGILLHTSHFTLKLGPSFIPTSIEGTHGPSFCHSREK